MSTAVSIGLTAIGTFISMDSDLCMIEWDIVEWKDVFEGQTHVNQFQYFPRQSQPFFIYSEAFEELADYDADKVRFYTRFNDTSKYFIFTDGQRRVVYEREGNRIEDLAYYPVGPIVISVDWNDNKVYYSNQSNQLTQYDLITNQTETVSLHLLDGGTRIQFKYISENESVGNETLFNGTYNGGFIFKNMVYLKYNAGVYIFRLEPLIKAIEFGQTTSTELKHYDNIKVIFKNRNQSTFMRGFTIFLCVCIFVSGLYYCCCCCLVTSGTLIGKEPMGVGLTGPGSEMKRFDVYQNSPPIREVSQISSATLTVGGPGKVSAKGTLRSKSMQLLDKSSTGLKVAAISVKTIMGSSKKA